jgi:alpha-glucosidase
VEKRGDYQPAWREIALLLPAGESRELWVNGVKAASYRLE